MLNFWTLWFHMHKILGASSEWLTARTEINNFTSTTGFGMPCTGCYMQAMRCTLAWN